jgi:hypothetical protein
MTTASIFRFSSRAGAAWLHVALRDRGSVCLLGCAGRLGGRRREHLRERARLLGGQSAGSDSKEACARVHVRSRLYVTAAAAPCDVTHGINPMLHVTVSQVCFQEATVDGLEGLGETTALNER